ncbi:MAG: glycosyltransferase [Candidatus Limnocylindrales bacterium]
MPRLLADLAAQDHRFADGSLRFEITVVDDRSTDGTGLAATRAAQVVGIGEVTRVIRCGPLVGMSTGPRVRPPPDGKGAALSATGPADYRGNFIAVLDADARAGPDYLRRAATYFARGAGATSARRRRLRHRPRNWYLEQLEGAQADEQDADGEIQLGRWGNSGCSEFRAYGRLVRRDLLSAAGGWHEDALREDLDLSSRLAILGQRVGWAADVVAWEEPVPDLGALRRQRVRWGEGIIRRELELTTPLLASPRLSLRTRLDYLAYSAQTALPVRLPPRSSRPSSGAWSSLVLLFATHLVPGSVLAIDSPALRGPGGSAHAPRADPAQLAAARLFRTLDPCVLRLLAARRVRRGPIRYAKTHHSGALDGFRPEAGGPGRSRARMLALWVVALPPTGRHATRATGQRGARGRVSSTSGATEAPPGFASPAGMIRALPADGQKPLSCPSSQRTR